MNAISKLSLVRTSACAKCDMDVVA
jgi:hypothetical protein